MVMRMEANVLQCEVLTGMRAGSIAFIPRISLSPEDNVLPVKMLRRQFPVRLAFCLTINKGTFHFIEFFCM